MATRLDSFEDAWYAEEHSLMKRVIDGDYHVSPIEMLEATQSIINGAYDVFDVSPPRENIHVRVVREWEALLGNPLAATRRYDASNEPETGDEAYVVAVSTQAVERHGWLGFAGIVLHELAHVQTNYVHGSHDEDDERFHQKLDEWGAPKADMDRMDPERWGAVYL